MLDKSNIAIFCMCAMFVGYLFPPAILSISMIAFGINALWGVHPRLWFKDKWWLMGVAWVAMFAISGLWSENKEIWETRVQLKLPFLILPLAFTFLPRFSAKQLQWFILSVAIMLTCGALYSMSFLILDPVHYIAEYKQSHILPTLPKGDHISASMGVSVFIISAVYMWPRLQERWVKWVVGICLCVLVVHLHVLAVKCGLISFYLFVVGWSIYVLVARRKIIGLAILLALPVVFFLVGRFVPTLHERVAYTWFSYFMFKAGDHSGKYGDISRLMSYSLSVKLIKQHPWLGVGAGDIKDQMDSAYARTYPDVQQVDRLYPHNQFLVNALGCGIPAMLIFVFWYFMPLARLKRNRQSFFFFMVWLMGLFELMIEPHLEGQLGIFVFLIYLLVQKHQMEHEVATPITEYKSQ